MVQTIWPALPKSAQKMLAVALSVSVITGCAAGESAPPEPPPSLDWEIIELDTVQVGRASGNATFQTEDELWFSGSFHGTTAIYKSTDGDSFTKQEIGEGVIAEYAQLGETVIGVGRTADRGVVHLSTDSGKTWEVLTPSTMKVNNAAVWLESVTVHNNQFVVAGTVRSANWHARLWTSPDGKNWTMAGEFRDEHPTSAGKVLSDGSTLVFATFEHYCSTESINSSAGGWYLGTWVDYLRIRQGAEVSALVKETTLNNPLILEPEIDCASLPSVSSQPDPDILLNKAIVFDGDIILILKLANTEYGYGYGLGRLHEGAWTLDHISALENVSVITAIQPFVLDDKLTLLWTKNPAESVEKYMAWTRGGRWANFTMSSDDSITRMILATEFKSRVYVWGYQFKAGGRAGDPMPWRLYRSEIPSS